MEEINLKELFDYFKERSLIMAVIALSVLVIGCAYSIFLKVPLYQSNSTIVLVSDDGSATGQGGYNTTDAQLNKNLVATYSDIIKSRRVLESVIKNLNLDYSYKTLYNNVSVTNTTNTEIIKIAVTDASSELATDIADEIVKVFGEEIKEIYKLQNVSIVDRASKETNPYNINVLKDTVIYLLIGLVLAIGIIFVVYYFDTTIKSAEDVENKLNIPVFGIVPKAKNKIKK